MISSPSGQSANAGCPFFVSPELTPRQRQTLSLAAQGLTELEIAGRLSVTVRTVREHLHTARERLGAANTTHAVALALVRQIIKLDTVLVN